jgi:hypothetical protein
MLLWPWTTGQLAAGRLDTVTLPVTGTGIPASGSTSRAVLAIHGCRTDVATSEREPGRGLGQASRRPWTSTCHVQPSASPWPCEGPRQATALGGPQRGPLDECQRASIFQPWRCRSKVTGAHGLGHGPPPATPSASTPGRPRPRREGGRPFTTAAGPRPVKGSGCAGRWSPAGCTFRVYPEVLGDGRFRMAMLPVQSR